MAQLVSRPDTIDQLRSATLAAASELVPDAPVGLAEPFDGLLRWTASAGALPPAALDAATDAIGSAETGVVVLRPGDGDPLLAVALRHTDLPIGALVLAAPAADHIVRWLEVLASAVGPKLGRFRDAALTQAILAHASEVFTVCKTDGTVIYQSPSAAQVFGVPPVDTVGRNLVDLVPADEAPRTLRALQLPAGSRSPAMGSRWTDDQGGTHFAETTAVNLVGEPDVGGILFVTRDVTDRRTLELELVHAQRLEAVGRLAAGIAHEVNTPVQFIGDNLHFLADAFDALLAATDHEPPPDGAEDAELAFMRHEIPLAVAQALQGVDRVAGIVRAMKALGHPDGGSPQQVDVNGILGDACTVAHSAFKHVAVLERDLGDLPPVRCLAGDVGQVLLNLLVNAADAVREAVAGTGELGRITLRTRQQGESVVVTVADTGAGIPPAVADHVFEPFFTTKAVGEGTGQGLALAAAVVERHGGTITFTSAPGEGTTFTVTLPVDGPPEQRRDRG